MYEGEKIKLLQLPSNYFFILMCEDNEQATYCFYVREQQMNCVLRDRCLA